MILASRTVGRVCHKEEIFLTKTIDESFTATTTGNAIRLNLIRDCMMKANIEKSNLLREGTIKAIVLMLLAKLDELLAGCIRSFGNRKWSHTGQDINDKCIVETSFTKGCTFFTSALKINPFQALRSTEWFKTRTLDRSASLEGKTRGHFSSIDAVRNAARDASEIFQVFC